jgi:hypothetical protein
VLPGLKRTTFPVIAGLLLFCGLAWGANLYSFGPHGMVHVFSVRDLSLRVLNNGELIESAAFDKAGRPQSLYLEMKDLSVFWSRKDHGQIFSITRRGPSLSINALIFVPTAGNTYYRVLHTNPQIQFMSCNETALADGVELAESTVSAPSARRDSAKILNASIGVNDQMIDQSCAKSPTGLDRIKAAIQTVKENAKFAICLREMLPAHSQPILHRLEGNWSSFDLKSKTTSVGGIKKIACSEKSGSAQFHNGVMTLFSSATNSARPLEEAFFHESVHSAISGWIEESEQELFVKELMSCCNLDGKSSQAACKALEQKFNSHQLSITGIPLNVARKADDQAQKAARDLVRNIEISPGTRPSESIPNDDPNSSAAYFALHGTADGRILAQANELLNYLVPAAEASPLASNASSESPDSSGGITEDSARPGTASRRLVEQGSSTRIASSRNPAALGAPEKFRTEDGVSDESRPQPPKPAAPLLTDGSQARPQLQSLPEPPSQSAQRPPSLQSPQRPIPLNGRVEDRSPGRPSGARSISVPPSEHAGTESVATLQGQRVDADKSRGLSPPEKFVSDLNKTNGDVLRFRSFLKSLNSYKVRVIDKSNRAYGSAEPAADEIAYDFKSGSFYLKGKTH